MLNELVKLPSQHPLGVIILLLVGILLWTAGYKLFRIFLALIGMMAGYYATQYVNRYVTFENTMYWLVLVLLCFAGAGLLWKAYRGSFALAGATVGYYLVTTYGWTSSPYLGVLAGAFLALIFCKVFLIVGSAALGTHLMLSNLAILLAPFLAQSGLSEMTSAWSPYLVPFVVLVLGVWIQLRADNKNPLKLFA